MTAHRADRSAEMSSGLRVAAVVRTQTFSIAIASGQNRARLSVNP
ncbi:MAG: hypothetical protein ABI323_14840 [Solirubrobacteraceae bacterium]